MNSDRPDFITIRLSDAALQQMGEGAFVRVTNAHYHYQFNGRTPVEVLRAGEWSALRQELLGDASPLFQAADAQSPATTSDTTSSEA